jgi:MoaA/NifB/PqqE/SkfB family radical SAM enzyme
MLHAAKPNSSIRTKPLDPLAYSHKTHSAMIEFTRACNLKCTYCAVSQSYWEPTELDLNKISVDSIIKSLKSRGTKTAILHGHGETTIVDNWHIYADKFINNGINATICTNLAKNFTEEEIEILSKFISITVSIDTTDPVLFKKMRRGGDLRQLALNMTKIKSKAMQKKHKINWIWSSVIADVNIHGVVDLVDYGLSLGVNTFCLCNLTVLPTPPGGLKIKHLSELPKEEAIKALELLNMAKSRCEQHGALFDVKAGLIDTLKRKVNAD